MQRAKSSTGYSVPNLIQEAQLNKDKGATEGHLKNIPAALQSTETLWPRAYETLRAVVQFQFGEVNLQRVTCFSLVSFCALKRSFDQNLLSAQVWSGLRRLYTFAYGSCCSG